MRVCVVGCGAVGSLFAAHLATLPDVEVWAYEVNAEHVAAINEQGLRLTGHVDLVARVQARSDAGVIPACDFGIVATKSTATQAAIAATAHLFGDGAVCSVQNGLGNEEVIAAHVERVIRGTTFPSGHVVGPGVVAMDTGGPTTIGPFEERPAAAAEIERLADAMTRGGLPARARADARGAQWTKVIFNAGANPLGALTGLTQGRLCEQPATRALMSGLVAEGVAVAAALGITLEEDPEEVIEHSARIAYDHRSSMLQDVLARRPTEIDALNGALTRLGREHGVATPLNAAVAALVAGLERSWSSQPSDQPSGAST
jgi:2-dehydropantoate 2-reductase